MWRFDELTGQVRTTGCGLLLEEMTRCTGDRAETLPALTVPLRARLDVDLFDEAVKLSS